MDALSFSLTTLCRHNADGSEATKANRLYGLMSISEELKGMGYGLKNARSLKPRHVTALVSHWKARGIAPATIKNRLAWVRWWARKVQKGVTT